MTNIINFYYTSTTIYYPNNCKKNTKWSVIRPINWQHPSRLNFVPRILK